MTMPYNAGNMAHHRYRGTIQGLLDSLPTIGDPLVVRAYRHMGLQEALMVHGTAGSGRCDDVEWGYSGERTQPVVELLVGLGIHTERAEHIVFNSTRHKEPGVDWIVNFLPSNRLSVLSREQINLRAIANRN